MRALLDVCALIALIDKNHVNHVKVGAWFTQNAPVHGWASCPLTQTGTARIIGNKGYPNKQPPQSTLALLAAMSAQPEHQLWPDSVSLINPSVFNQAVMLTSDHITGVYLLALAVSNGSRLVTTDGGILTTAVVGFRQQNLVLL